MIPILLNYIQFTNIGLFVIINREDRETELLCKLEDYEMRDNPNERMISHLNKMIALTKVRVDGAKVRCSDLMDEVKSMKEEVVLLDNNEKKKKKRKKNYENGTSTVEVDLVDTTVIDELNDDSNSDIESDSDGYESSEEDEDDDIGGVEDESEIVLHFDGTRSSISTPVPLGTVNDEQLQQLNE